MLQDEKKKLSRNLSDKFRDFIAQHPPSQFSRRLRCLLLDYMMMQQKVGFPLDFHIQLWELSDLFMLLDCAEDEWERKSNPEVSKSVA